MNNIFLFGRRYDMLYVVSYDIPGTGRRTKLAKAFKDFGYKAHYGVFECILDSSLLNKMVTRILL